jgi:pilus assembly protein Flp/PilA
VNVEPGNNWDVEIGPMTKFARGFWSDESGATAIEYGLIASILGVLLIAAFKSVGSKLTSTFNDIASNLSS